MNTALLEKDIEKLNKQLDRVVKTVEMKLLSVIILYRDFITEEG